MSELEKKDPGDKCNARKSSSDGYCQHAAGWGTDHPGHGRCKYHGGNSPSGEKAVLKDLEDAAEHASTALQLKLKDIRRRLENGDDVDPQELDRLARTVFDRTGYGPTETREVTGDDGGAVEVNVDFTDVDT